jgi:two-component system response regulator AtoC
LEKEIQKGNFRKDLYYRLSVITLTIPPLRKRREDIPALANHFLSMYTMKLGREINQFSQAALEALCQYPWPGNIRELMNVIERAILLSRSNVISINNLPNTFLESFSPSMDLSNLDLSNFNDLDLSAWKGKTLSEVRGQVLDQVEKKYLAMILEQTRGKIGEAAGIAGIHPRGLYGKMKKLGLDKTDFKSL